MAEKRGRKPKELSADVQAIILRLIGDGLPDKRIRRAVGVDPGTWHRFAERNPNFSARLEKAEIGRRKKHVASFVGSMWKMIDKGHPWWAKLAIHNGLVPGIEDPDVRAAVKVKRLAGKPQTDDADSYFEADPAVAPAVFPPGATPATAIVRPVPDRPGGPAVRQDGDSQAVPGGMPVAGERAPPPVE